MKFIAENIARIYSTLPPGTTLVAVSKFHPAQAVMEAYEAGQRIFGESRAAELQAKASSLPNDICWHFIGHLQTNKIKQVLPYAALIQSVDSERLLRAIDSEARRLGMTAGVLLQVHVAAEETKFGFLPDELIHIASTVVPELSNVKVHGIMGMATNTTDKQRIASDFSEIARCSRMLRQQLPDATEISIGMSHDYPLALEQGSTIVRIGTSIFGERTHL